MMNKKAIAAFAAGATLLAGFAMATPAFAAETPNNGPKKVLTKQEAKKVAEEKQQAYLKLVQTPVAEAGTEPVEPQAEAVKKLYTKDANGKLTLKADTDTDMKAATVENKGTASKYVNDHNAWLNAGAAHKKYVDDVAAALKAWTDAEAAVKTAAADPVEKSDDDQKDEAIANVMNAKGKLDRLRVKKNKLYSEVKKKYRALKDAEANEKSTQKALDAAEEALREFNDSGKEDSARAHTLELKVSRAEAKHDAAKKDLGKASHDYDEVHNKYTDEVLPAFKAAKKTYDDAYDAAIRLGVDPAKLPLVSTAEDPLENDFLGDPGTAADILSGKTPAQPGKQGAPAAGANGAAGKAGANGSAAAGAKTEVENKNGKDKRGNTHTGTGVGVTLTALAATMLAGMGAAVRKARH